MTVNELEKIAHKLIADKIAQGEEVQMEWAVHELIKQQGTISGAGKGFYALCAREFVYRVVKKAVDKYESESSAEDGAQKNLEGFDYLQVAYTVARDDVRVLVPIDLITDEELEKRAEEYDRQAIGMQGHAQEIRNYIAARNKTAMAV